MCRIVFETLRIQVDRAVKSQGKCGNTENSRLKGC